MSAKRPGDTEFLLFTKKDERTVLAPGKEVEFRSNPSVPFLPVRLLADRVDRFATDLMVTSLQLSRYEQLIMPVPLLAIIRHPIVMPACKIDQSIRIVLKNEGKVDTSFMHLRFQGIWAR